MKNTNGASGGIERISHGIVMFKGRMSRNLMWESIASNIYFLEDEDEVVLFDASSGKETAKRFEAYIRTRLEARAEWKRAFLIAGHSHSDHAGNLYLSEVLGAQETRMYIHESGFQNGRVKNDPVPFAENVIRESKKYYNFYRSFSFPYNLFMYPLAALDELSPALVRRLFGRVSGMLWPVPANGSVSPEPLRQNELQTIYLGDHVVSGWHAGSKVILPTPGHSSCSVSLYWPERKALFISDADWIGDPVFVSSSVRDSISSLEKMKELTEAGKVILLLPAHGHVQEGSARIVSYLEYHIRRLEVMRNEVLSAYRSYGEEKDVRTLTRILVRESPLFRMLKLANYPRLVLFVHNVVAVCLREEGILN